MDRAAEVIRGRAVANAASHVRTGRYISSIRVRNDLYVPAGVLDRVVVAEDPQSWKIEFGFRHADSGEWIPGQFIMTNAVNRG